MPRARNIKPSLFKNEILGEADPLLTILFTGLWCLADRDGKLEDRPKRIKAEIFPYRELPDFNGYLTVLEQMGFIERYSVENQAIVKVLNFDKHQSPHKTEKKSELPNNPENTGLEDITDKAPLNNGSATSLAALIPDSGFLIPEDIGEDLWTDFLEVRKKKKAVNSHQALMVLIGKLEALKAQGHNPADVVSESVVNSWKSVFTPKGSPRRDSTPLPENL